MSQDQEIDVDALRSELEEIKDAMGLTERYPTEFRVWLVYAVLVPLASFGSQAVVAYDLPPWGHWLSWGVFMGLGGLYQWRLAEVDTSPDAGGKPGLGVPFLACFGYALAVLVIVGPLLGAGADLQAQSTIFAILVGAVGLTYVLAANVLRAYYIRRLDRLAFLVGGLWMLGLSVAIARVPLLQRWGYAVFGVAYFLFGVGAYVVLKRRDGRGERP